MTQLKRLAAEGEERLGFRKKKNAALRRIGEKEGEEKWRLRESRENEGSLGRRKEEKLKEKPRERGQRTREKQKLGSGKLRTKGKIIRQGRREIEGFIIFWSCSNEAFSLFRLSVGGYHTSGSELQRKSKLFSS